MSQERINLNHLSSIDARFPNQILSSSTSAPYLNNCYDKTIELAFSLQKSLNIYDIVNTFSNIIKDIFPFDGLRFTYPAQKIDISLGEAKPHQAKYQLNLDEQPLGHLAFTRHSTFSEEELSTIEFMISSLIYPLNNALKYAEAIQNSLEDPLTHVGNRRAMLMTLHREVELSKRHHTDLSLMILDIDYFKDINDTLGHSAGDLVLQKMVKAISDCIREYDVIFRYGGDEFIILLRKTNLTEAKKLGGRIKNYIHQTVHVNSQSPFSISIGATTLKNTDDADTLFDRADDALLKAKQNGRNCIEFI